MIRFVFACAMYTLIANWGYKEASIIFPEAMPYLNTVLAKIQIPTHNHWSRKDMEQYVENATDYIDKAEDAVQDIKDIVENNRDVMRRG